MTEWKAILRANPAQGRQVLAHLLGPITITEEIGAMMSLEPLEGYDPNDRRGKEHLSVSEIKETLADIRWSAETKPAGLLAGLSVVQQVASPPGGSAGWCTSSTTERFAGWWPISEVTGVAA